MSGPVPSRPVTAALYGDYFAAADMNVAGMSSHWRAYAPKSRVRVNEDGVPVEAVGVGFGDMNARRFGNAVLTPAAAILHGLRHPAPGSVPAAIAAARRVSRRAGLVFNQDALRQALTFALLETHLRRRRMRRVMMIGDGYGLLGAVLAAWRPDVQVVFVDLGRSLLFQALTCSRVFPSAGQALVGEAEGQRIEDSRFLFCPADRIEQLPSRPLDLAVNVASMQEMSADVVASYFDLLRAAPTEWFYCCNRERKVMPGGEVSAFANYPWVPADVHVIDEPCPWHQWYLAPRKTAGLLPVSLCARYDGVHLHRLTRLAPAGSGGPV
jgi:hypothetical protein